MIHVLDGNNQLGELEGIKFAKFLKRLTGSKRVGTALLKIGAVTAAGTGAYYANKKYHILDKIKATTFPQKASQPPQPAVNRSLLERIIDTFLPQPAVAQQVQPAVIKVQKQSVSQKQTAGRHIDPLVIAALGAVGIGAFMLLRKR